MIIEYGYYHPDRGYWQTTNKPSKVIFDMYPIGTIEVPLRPNTNVQWLDGQWKPVVPILPSKTELLAYSSNKRWEKENGGFELGEMFIATDDRSKTMITGARIKADGDPTFTTPWKGPDGSFNRITAPAIIMISDAMLNHVAACFDKEEAISIKIMNGTFTTTAQIDGAWNV